MRFRLYRLRLRRQLKKQRRQVEDFGLQAEENLERHFLERFDRLLLVRRFVIGWLLLFLLLLGCGLWQLVALSSFYQAEQPVPGGVYSEGLLGSFTTANPLYATNDVDTTVSKLIFAGLFKYDNQNKLVGDLASSYSVDSKGLVYTVKLKPNLTWQDGTPLTSADVVFTYDAIQNPDARSVLENSWQGINVSAPDPLTVLFRLPNPLASFPYNLTNGILPKHLLSGIPMVDLRSADFNTNHPIGAGPFEWAAFQVSGSDPTNAQEQVALKPFNKYHGSAPKLQEFIVHSFASKDQLIQAFAGNQLTAISGINSYPSRFSKDKSINIHQPLLTAATMVFFKTSSGLLGDQSVRRALVQAAQPAKIIAQLGYNTRPVREPLLEGQLAYDPTYAQAGYNLKAAQSILDQDGWKIGKNSIRYKNGQPLAFSLVAPNTLEYQMVTKELTEQWRLLGLKLLVRLEANQDFSSTLASHDYDAVLYGISIGVDPDVFVYWDSSQANILAPNRLNLSEYKSTEADSSLEAGRTRLDPALRVIKYKPFLQAWQTDSPALGLYQPRYLYLTHGTVYGLTDHSLNTPTDRFNNVENWMIRSAKVTD
ncbi:MAG TPA: ABC transporter substrate-binding protein [Candidatus Dormibacteraeota bacterium]|nr:ABC transporter substrate-binding protein [Candidatus Dormibacteraeota bacterium]